MEHSKQNDRLRGEFTVWLEKLIVRAKLSFIRQHSKYLKIISIEDLSEEAFAILDEPIVSRDTFEFEDEKIAVFLSCCSWKNGRPKKSQIKSDAQ